MPKANKRFTLLARATALGERRGEVMIYSGISTYKWDEDDPTVTSNDFDKQLKALGEVDEITVRINSPGGVVSEAIAIRTALMKHPAKKTIDIEGCCDSAATLIACLPGATVRMAKGGEYMIHCCYAGAWGHADDLLSAYNSMRQTDSDMADIYAERTGKTQEECLELMRAETWYGAAEAMEAGFVDEMITPAEDAAMDMVACALSEEEMDLMRACYAHTPPHVIRAKADEETTSSGAFAPPHGGLPARSALKTVHRTVFRALEPPEGEGENTPHEGENEDSNGSSAVAAERLESQRDSKSGLNGRTADGQIGDLSAAPFPTVIEKEGVNTMDELRNATAEQLQQENPDLVQALQNEAVTAERNRVQEIDDLTPPGEEYRQMAQEAKANGTTSADFLKAIIAKQRQAGRDYLEHRQAETAQAENVGAGDSGDHDEPNDKAASDKLAKELADMANNMRATSDNLA